MNTPSRIPESADIKEAQAFENEKLDFSTSLNSILQFHPESFTLVLDLENVFIPESLHIAVSGYNLLPKNEFHVTIIGSKIAKKIIKYSERLNAHSKKVFMQIFQKLIRKYDFQVLLGDEIFYIEKSYDDWHRFSVIQLASVEKLSDFYNDLGMLIWQDLEIPFPHITLFTNTTNPEKKLRWIWIYSQKEFEEFEPIKIN